MQSTAILNFHLGFYIISDFENNCRKLHLVDFPAYIHVKTEHKVLTRISCFLFLRFWILDIKTLLFIKPFVQ